MAGTRITCVFFLALGGLLSCGLEAYYYIDYIPASNYTSETGATVRLPSSEADGYGGENQYFRNFIIFYRIYLSDNNPTGRLDDYTPMTSINNALYSDYVGLSTYTDITNTSVTTSNLDTTFRNKSYYKLELTTADIDSVLDTRSLGKTLEISFLDSTGELPILLIGGESYVLKRATDIFYRVGGGQPVDNLTFLNYPELYDVANAIKDRNADVATNSKANIRYTYVSMYIAAVGRSGDTPPTTIFSQPTFIGIFKLPEW
jgi:hypothetical protein